MDSRRACALLASLILLAAGTSGPAWAQEATASEAISCGYVADDEALSGYFRDLCRAALSAVHTQQAVPEPLALTAEEAVAALSEADPPLVYALPFELRADAPYALGPVVWIGADARWAAAHAEDRPHAGDLGAWLFHALVQAEVWGVDRAAVEGGLGESGLARGVGERFRAYEARLTGQLGLPADALRTMIATVGHHGEIRDRWFTGDMGPNRPVELGGQLYAPPVGPE